jgi:hypothetical protein
MANDKRFIVKNGLRADNVEFTDSQDGSNQITLNMLNTDTLNFEGDAGSLFSITDDLTGSVFSVGDISGIPIIDVNGDTHNVTFNEFDGKVMIGGTDSGSTDSDVLNVTGNVRATAYYGDGSNLTGISASGGTDSATVSAIITADVDKTFIDALNVNAATVTATANNTNNESVFITFVDGASGTQGIETDTGLTYNPSTQILTLGTGGDNVTFDDDGTITANGNSLKLKSAASTVSLLHTDGNTKLATASYGVAITGTAAATTFSGSGASLTSLPAGQLTGTVSDARLPSSISSDITGNAASATALATARNIDITGVTATAQSFDGTGDIDIEVTAVPASLLTGTIDSARLPVIASANDAGTLDGINSTSFLRSDAADTKTSGDLTFSDNVSAKFGTGGDLSIYHNSANSYIDNTIGNLYIRDNGFGAISLQPTSGENSGVFNANGSVDLYYDNSKKFETTDSGAEITGYPLITAGALGTSAGDTVELLDLRATQSGNTSRLRVFTERDSAGADWTTAYTRIQQIVDVTEMSYIQFNGDGKTYGMEFGTNGDELYQKNVRNGQVELYYNNNKKFETTNTGATITGTATATTFSGSGASLTNLPSSQLTGALPAIDGSALTGISAGGTDSATVSAIITADVDQAFVNALNVDADTLDTLNSTSFLRSDAADTKTSGNLTFNDDIQAWFGTGSDLRIYHASSGTKNWISSFTGDIEIITTGGDLKLTTTGGNSTDFTGNVDFTAATVTGLASGGLDSADVLTVAGTGSLTGVSGGFAVNGLLSATTKSFDIEHPTEEGKRLRYGSLEGPENGVYVRGRLKGDNRIQLPDHWTGLVDEDTITVNLTPIDNQQSLFVEDIRDNQVLIGGDENINCFYTVYGERKDVDQLIVEYDE